MTLDKEISDKNDTYFYDFSTPENVFVSNYTNEFNGKLSLVKNGNLSILITVNGDVEDQELYYAWHDHALMITGIVEDADPNNDNSSIIVRTVREHGKN